MKLFQEFQNTKLSNFIEFLEKELYILVSDYDTGPEIEVNTLTQQDKYLTELIDEYFEYKDGERMMKRINDKAEEYRKKTGKKLDL